MNAAVQDWFEILGTQRGSKSRVHSCVCHPHGCAFSIGEKWQILSHQDVEVLGTWQGTK
jgi:hypothetical protein